MSVTTSNFHFPPNGWCNRATSMMIMAATASSESVNTGSSPNVDDGLTSLSWLQNLNMCMTRLGAPTPPTPPASPICSTNINNSTNCSNNTNNNNINNNKNITINSNTSVSSSSTVESAQNTNIQKIHSLFQNHRDQRSYQNGNAGTSKKLSQTCENETVDYKTNGNVKPPFSYATLICMAMKANKNKMTLSAIYKWIRENFMYYKNADPSWQNSIRHNLSLNKCFIKIPRNKDEPGKGGFWRLDPVYADTLVDGVFKKRRPSQRGSNSSNSNNTSAPFRKKSRKKEPPRNDSSISGGNNLISNGIETTIIHETPPNSAESYNVYGEAPNDVVELVTAVSSIESVGHCPSYSYTMHTNHSECEQHLSHQGYGDEVCITEATSDTCMLETDGNDICWNAILTDADLNELVDPVSYTGPVIHSAESSLTVSDSTTTTAQLTAVEPHSLHLVASASPITTVHEQSELFQNGVTRHINCLAINHRSNIGSDVISATHNVVTCVNPTNVSTNEWNPWPTFSTVTNHDNQNSNTDLLIRQISGNCESIVSRIVSPSPPIAYITTTASITSRPTSGAKQSNCVNNQQNINSNSASSTQPSSPTSGNFEHTNALQPWAECKAALEAAALDLESFGSLDVVHNY